MGPDSSRPPAPTMAQAGGGLRRADRWHTCGQGARARTGPLRATGAYACCRSASGAASRSGVQSPSVPSSPIRTRLHSPNVSSFPERRLEGTSFPQGASLPRICLPSLRAPTYPQDASIARTCLRSLNTPAFPKGVRLPPLGASMPWRRLPTPNPPSSPESVSLPFGASIPSRRLPIRKTASSPGRAKRKGRPRSPGAGLTAWPSDDAPTARRRIGHTRPNRVIAGQTLGSEGWGGWCRARPAIFLVAPT